MTGRMRPRRSLWLGIALAVVALASVAAVAQRYGYAGESPARKTAR